MVRVCRIRSTSAVAVVAALLVGPAVPLAAAPAAALAPEQRAACTSDVFRLCGAEVPRVDHIIACLKKARPSLSPACRALVDLKG